MRKSGVQQIPLGENEQDDARAVREATRAEVCELLPSLSTRNVSELLELWPVDHLREARSSTVATIVRLLEIIAATDRARVLVLPASSGRLDVIAVAHDGPGLALVSTGVLAGAGYGIVQGRLFNLPGGLSDHGGAAERAVQLLTAEPVTPPSQSMPTPRAIQAKMARYLSRWSRGDKEQVRGQLETTWMSQARWLCRCWGDRKLDMEVRFDNRLDPARTVVDLQADDARGLLYGAIHVLALRGIKVWQCCIRTCGARAVDQFHVTDAYGHKFTDVAAQREGEAVTVLLKAYCRFLRWAADPYTALTRLTLLMEHQGQAPVQRNGSVLAADAVLDVMARVLGCGNTMLDDYLRPHFEHVMPVVLDASVGRSKALPCPLSEGPTAQRRSRLARWLGSESFRAKCGYLLGKGDRQTRLGLELTRLAEEAVTQALDIALREIAEASPSHGRSMPPLALVALGTFGGRELGIASDLDSDARLRRWCSGVRIGPRATARARRARDAGQHADGSWHVVRGGHAAPSTRPKRCARDVAVDVRCVLPHRQRGCALRAPGAHPVAPIRRGPEAWSDRGGDPRPVHVRGRAVRRRLGGRAARSSGS